MIILTINFV